MKRPARVPSQLSSSLHHRLNAYALAASAAGVGALVLAQSAEAKIIYTGTHKVIRLGHPFALDLNHDGTADFSFSVTTCKGTQTGCPFTGLEIKASSANSIADGGYSTFGFGLAHALPAGAKIPGKNIFGGGGLLAFSRYKVRYGGYWLNVKDHYLGLTFFIHGTKHYGWARMNVHTTKDPFTVTGILTGYAYETIPNKPIIAGKTHGRDDATLGHLATGASAIPAWRMKPTAATSH